MIHLSIVITLSTIHIRFKIPSRNTKPLGLVLRNSDFMVLIFKRIVTVVLLNVVRIIYRSIKHGIKRTGEAYTNRIQTKV